MEKERIIRELSKVEEEIMMNNLQIVMAFGNKELGKKCQEKKEELEKKKQELRSQLKTQCTERERMIINLETNPFYNHFSF